MGIADPFAHNLRVLLARQAIERPSEVGELLNKGQGKDRWLAPLRQDDGRLGYPLSGRLSGSSRSRGGPWMIQAELRRIYPTYSDAQVSAWQVKMQRTGRDMAQELRQLRHELKTLEQSLNTWLTATTALLERSDRRRVTGQLLACWQRVIDEPSQLNSLAIDYRLELNGLRPGFLPLCLPAASPMFLSWRFWIWTWRMCRTISCRRFPTSGRCGSAATDCLDCRHACINCRACVN